MNHSNFVHRVWAAMVVLMALATLTNSLHAADAKPPNVVLIISDDQGWNDYSFLGHEQIRTPRLDRLASESLTFRRGYVVSSLCRPSLMTMFTGLYPHQNGITCNDPPLPTGASRGGANRDPGFLAQRKAMTKYVEQSPTLARELGKRGYRSLQTGKWWEGNWKNGGFTHGMTQGERHGDQGLDIGRKTMQPVYDFIDESRAADKPFFVWYAPMLPHSPHNPPDRLLDKYKDRAPTLAIAKYWACVEWFDETCGQLLDFLDQRKLTDDTLVLYITDNGWLQDPNLDKYLPRSKQSQYDTGLRTPIMVRWPGRVDPRTSDDFAQSIDLMPTILTAVGAKLPANLPGVNLLDATTVAARKTLYGTCYTHNAVDIDNPAKNVKYRWCIDGQLKLIVPDKSNVPEDVVELYDLGNDPGETKNLASSKPDDVQRLTKLLEGWWKKSS